MPKKVKSIPKGYTSVTPYMTHKNTAEAIKLYQKAFGAKVMTKMTGPGGKVMHAEILIGNAIVMMGDEWPGMGPTAPTKDAPSPMNLFIYTEKVDSAFKKAIKAGCEVEMPLADQFWGDRYGKLKDPFGYTWAMGEHIEDVTPAEMKKRQKAWEKEMAKQGPPPGAPE